MAGEAVQQTLILPLLGQMGLPAGGVNNGAELLVAIGKDKFDLIIMNCNMPIIDGFEAARRIRAASPTGSARP